eukprot:366169-Chlamydomonas_euryale.AAC.2
MHACKPLLSARRQTIACMRASRFSLHGGKRLHACVQAVSLSTEANDCMHACKPLLSARRQTIACMQSVSAFTHGRRHGYMHAICFSLQHGTQHGCMHACCVVPSLVTQADACMQSASLFSMEHSMGACMHAA